MSLIDKVRELFKTETPTEEIQTFEDVKDSNGNIIRIDSYEKGGAVNLISSDGTLIPLEPGEYKLDDGRTFTVTEKGIIDNVSPADSVGATDGTPDDTGKDTTPNKDVPAEVVQPVANGTDNVSQEQPIDKVGQRLDALEAQMTEVMSAFEELMNQMSIKNEAFTKLEEIKKDLEKEIKDHKKTIKELERTPAGDPVQIQMSKAEDVSDGPNYAKMFEELKTLKKR